MKPIVTWILIADGAEARVFANAGPGKGLQPVDGLEFHQGHLAAREIMADRPGRSIQSAAAGGRSAMEYPTDPVAERERRFVVQLAEVLGEHHRKGEFARLVIAAAPTALGDIRPALGKDLRSAIVAEIPKDLTNVPQHELESHFADILAV